MDCHIEEREGLGMATVMAGLSASASALREALNVAPPSGPRWAREGDLTLLGVGPRAWLAVQPNAPPDFAVRLRETLTGLASVSDQSSGYAVYRLSGEGARDALQRGAAIDLDPSVFQPGSVASTSIAHIGVTIWQPEETPTYDVALFRSFQASFRDWLAHVVATFQ